MAVKNSLHLPEVLDDLVAKASPDLLRELPAPCREPRHSLAAAVSQWATRCWLGRSSSVRSLGRLLLAPIRSKVVSLPPDL